MALLAGLIVAAAAVGIGAVVVRQSQRTTVSAPGAGGPGGPGREASAARAGSSQPSGRGGLAGQSGPAGQSGLAGQSEARGHGGPPGPAGQAAATTAGHDGIEARWVIDENQRPGTTAWKIRGSHGSIAGFADHSYARQGQQVTLYVSTAAARFRAEAFRMGYYQGKGARLVWRSAEVRDKVQAACPVTAGTRMVACDNWAPSLQFRVSPAFVPGDYLIKLVGSGSQQSYIPLTIWDPASTATYVVKNDVFTWQAWNPYGGFDLYQGLGACPARTYPLCSRARVVSFDRPYGTEGGSGNFLTLEYPLVRFAEQHGLDVTYATDLTIDQHPGYLGRHRALLSLGHDEAWSLSERRAAVAARDRGVNIVFFAASPILRHVRMRASVLGPDREEVDYRDPREDPLHGRRRPLQVTGNTWGSPPTNWPESDFVGEMYAGFLNPGLHVGLKVADASAWVFSGTGVHNGTVVPGVVAADVDHYYPAMAHPGNVQVLAHSPIPAGHGQTDLGAFYSDMTYYTDPRSGAGVLDTGTSNWIPALLSDRSGCGGAAGACADGILRHITGNILRVFGQGPAGRARPAVANARRVTGQ